MNLADGAYWEKLLLNSVGPVFGPVLAIVVAYLGGAKLTRIWNLRQKREELGLAAASRFYELYGEFFAIWKLWNNALSDGAEVDSVRRDLISRAASAEAGMEALYVRLALNEILTARDVDDIGRFRQAYQLLKTRIRLKKPLNWSESSHAEYLTFKRLACRIATILEGKPPGSETDAYIRLRRITDNFWEKAEHWVLPSDLLLASAAPISPA